MEFIVLSKEQKKQYEKEIVEMMKVSDEDFVPPLSHRKSTTQTDLSFGEGSIDGLYSYFNEMVKQEILGFFDDDTLLGFVSFKENYLTNEIKNTPNIYLSTLILKPEARGKNLTFKAYDYLFNVLYPKVSIYTRTWSTNFAHIKILSKFNFELLLRKPNDRGEGIDTVYFCLER